jgi:2,5-diamino-6-(ribosylamino)-4(3H)-pyrimidinone 5'-phosphate reductase
MLPRLIVHNAVSLDSRIEGFPADVGLYYELAERWRVDAHLAGCDTMLQMEGEIPDVDDSVIEPPSSADSNDPRPLLVVPDSRGRLRRWRGIRRMPYWRGTMALCSRSTAQEYLENLIKWHVPYLVAGDDYVDLSTALELLNLHFNVKTVHADSGGTLSGVLLRAGLVDEVSVLIHPHLVGATRPRSFFRPQDLGGPTGCIPLRLTHVERMRDDIVWVRYEVVKETRHQTAEATQNQQAQTSN